jgi:glycosyltransferase involved in cell wall biosynthesis
MKVSVIIPTYNRENFVCEAIESVLQQTMTDIEVIVVDDGSTDRTREILKPYKETIRYIYTKNGGPAHARNVGLKNAKGEYIAFLDSDDLYYPYKIELQSKFLDKFIDVGMVYTEFSGFDDNGFFDEYHLRKYHTAYKSGKLTYEDFFSEKTTLKDAGLVINSFYNKVVYMGNIFNDYFKQIIVFTNSIMFRRNILKTVGFQDEHYWLFEEFEFALRICKHYKVAFIDLPTYKLRYHRGQISNTSEKSGINVVVKKQENLLEIAEKHGLKDKNFYSQNKDIVNKTLAILRKALAIPLMVKGNDNKRARKLLKECALYGHPEYFFWLLTFAPYIVRRVVIKVFSILKVS